MIQDDNPVVFAAPDFEFVRACSSQYVAGVRKDFFFNGGGVYEVESRELAFVDEGSVRDCEKGGCFEPVAIHGGV